VYQPPLIRGGSSVFRLRNILPASYGLNGHGTVKETKWSQLEKDLVREINKFRADPVAWYNPTSIAAAAVLPAYGH
jgi:hypothetical protein